MEPVIHCKKRVMDHQKADVSSAQEFLVEQLLVSSTVCRSSGGHRRNPDFSRPNKQVSRNRNKQNEERSGFENLDESDLLTSKNGSLLSFSGTPKFQATATTGQREEEIVELFRKVQTQLRERAAAKEDIKVEASQGKGRENETVDSLLKLLRKHSTGQGKKINSNVSIGNFNLDQPENGAYKKAKSTSSFNSSKKERNNTLEPNNSFSRPPSNFRRKSPVPQVKFQPIYSGEDLVNSASHLNLNGEKKNQFEILPDTTEELELDPEIEPEEEPELDSEQEPESSFPAGDVFDELSERESSDIENVDEGGEKHQLTEHEDLSSLKLPELRVLARSRGMKGFSRMKKGELVGLLSGSSV
ncbi:RHO-N DOMAIN-CONTAINING PROTEIN 1 CHLOROPLASTIC [Salix koriyanagi]|uniref:RHO-N DOMAIN-CONTAINING PROTEIN 1 CHLOROPLASTIC n=1 Tax=Salix koriyanagi TaxID=2511006 RepID=A0A9Q0P4R6_9ROSI|nr:RHO-N DOMAIN-CONTAINING PROTEIN 1 CHLOROPLASTIC [Salix koriyanagi]